MSTLVHPQPPVTGRHTAAAATPATPGPAGGSSYLPQPPDDVERDLYLGPQHRWIPAAGFVGYLLIVLSLSFFIGRHHWTALLILPVTVSFVSTALSLITVSRRRRVHLVDHRARVTGWQPTSYPSVDVFLPSAGESLPIIENTFRYVSELHWGGELTIHVLDDSGRAEVRALAGAHGFRYLSRPDRGHLKKAGNLRYGYEHSRADLIAIFDADFVPRADFLNELAPYLDDDGVGIVQSPQYFDVHPHMNWLQRAAGATQVLFYRYVQPGRDASKAAICVGTSAVYRRAALIKAGGFAQISHSEDVHTGIAVMNAGFEIRYVPTVVSKGACPDTFDGFITQQYRWCGGSMSLLFSGRFRSVKLTRMQRACYWSGFTYYISTALDLITAALPTLLMVFFFADRVRVQNYIFVMGALAIRQALVPLITGGADSLISLSRIQTTYSFAHLVNLWDRFSRHKDEEGWVATGAATTRGSARSRRVLKTARVWLLTYQVLLWSGIAWRLPQYGLGRLWPMIALGLFNLYISYPIIAGTADLPRFQRAVRRVVETGTVRSGADA